MEKPSVAIIGRPNVGKSTLFNRIVGKRISIVEDTPGVTRDRIYADAEWCGCAFTMIDTGGLALKSEDEMWMHIKEQAQVAADTCDVIIFVVDGKAGVSAEDYDVTDFLRQTKKPCLLVVNKIDNNEMDLTYDFYQLGMGEPLAVSAQQMKGIGDLLDEVVALFKTRPPVEDEDDTIKIAIVGRPNAGKSSIVNRLLGKDRVIVSAIAGTTRDAIDSPIEVDGQKYILIDTAGIRRKRSIDEDLETYSVMRSFAAIRRADIALVVCDATEELSEQDVRIAGYVHEEGKPSVIVMNKWDAVEKDTFTINKFNANLSEDLKFMDYFKPIYISALKGKRTDTIIPTVKAVFDNSRKRITTGLLNDVLQDAILTNEPPSRNGIRLKIYYATQVAISPPTFVLKVNNPDIMHFSYKRYLENAIRKSFGFEGTPINLYIRNKSDKDV